MSTDCSAWHWVREPGRSSTLPALGAAAVLRRAGAAVVDIVGRRQADRSAAANDPAVHDVVVAVGAHDVAARLAGEWAVPLALVDPQVVDTQLAERLVTARWEEHPVVVVDGTREPGSVVLAEAQVRAGRRGLRVTVDGGESFGASTVVVRTADPLGLMGDPGREPACRLVAAADDEEPPRLRGDMSTVVVESDGRLRIRADRGTTREATTPTRRRDGRHCASRCW